MERQVHDKFFRHHFTCSLIWGMTLVIQCWAQGNVVTENETVMLERPASLKCTVQTTHEPLIVTWQKLRNERPENMATFSKQHGIVIQSTYKSKIEMSQPGLRESTITFLRTAVEDEGCYLCIFNIFGVETASGKTCLILYVQPTVFLNYQFSEGHLNVTCSATARPPPVISWKVGAEVQNSTEKTLHQNGTTSVTSILYIKDSDNQVGKKIFCNVKHMENMLEYSVDPNQRCAASNFSVPIFVGILVPVVILLTLITILLYWKYRRQSRGI
ncbi:OX-2 membrane glycoprotein-like isoform X1 [Dromiciops gliroides]|uniref:OX-2 membrane glycoprotein-like isoform X1 n=2 Tax=Dromiciops gliroides TaxID=33562 RepID=UPI001CC38215|nr:OX-2 membrane glycoprotein-like isoform X1 [Dromiciops gliroides]XP_043852049.1 OX-2 membrane glycoprotein-like isoform X1 [Dromiciops gliroides]